GRQRDQRLADQERAHERERQLAEKDLLALHRRHADHPEALPLQRELREDEAAREGRQRQRRRQQVHLRDQVLPEDVAVLVGEGPQVQEVDRQQAEEDQELRPLDGVAEEALQVLGHDQAHVAVDEEQQRRDEAVDEAPAGVALLRAQALRDVPAAQQQARAHRVRQADQEE